jgi:hypothetical protein
MGFVRHCVERAGTTLVKTTWYGDLAESSRHMPNMPGVVKCCRGPDVMVQQQHLTTPCKRADLSLGQQ